MGLSKFRRLRWLLFLTAIPYACLATTRVDVAVISDGPQYQLQEVGKFFLEELAVITDGEFDVRVKPLVAQWSIDSVNRAMESAYQDPGIDLVLVLGFAGNQLAVVRETFPKPTFLPLVFNPDLLGAPVAENRSGKKNLNYLAERIPFGQDVKSFQRVAQFNNAVVLVDAVIMAAIPRAPQLVREQAPEVNFSFIGHDGKDHGLIEQIPADAEAVLLGGLPRMPKAAFEKLLDKLAARGLPSFSLVGENEVERGALAADSVQTDMQRLARRNALNMQAVMLGEKAENQPVFFDGKRQLTINMETARRIGLSPRFDVLSEAELVNAEAVLEGPELDLASVARRAVDLNLDLAVSRLDVEIGRQDVLGARSNLLPQLAIGSTSTVRRDKSLTRSAASPERSSAAALTLDQLVYSETATSGYQQQLLLQDGREAALETARLDRILEATTAYLQALRADTQLEIQQDNLDLTKTNLELARDRVRVGSASNADIYRWEANLAEARGSVLSSLATSAQTRQGLNRILNQPIDTQLRLRRPSKGDAFTLPPEKFDALIDNPRRFGWFIDYSVSEGLRRAPELQQLEAQISAAEREITAKKRAYWLPDFSVRAQYNDAIEASGRGAGTAFDHANDWNVSLNANLPLFAGGSRRVDVSRATLQREQLRLQMAASSQRIEQQIRSALHAAQASYVNIDLSERGAEAARKNLELVSDAYRQGTVTIIDLLDAQNQSLQAELSSNNAVHDFLIDIMNLQRASNAFNFLLDPSEKNDAKQNLLDYIENQDTAYRASRNIERSTVGSAESK